MYYYGHSTHLVEQLLRLREWCGRVRARGVGVDLYEQAVDDITICGEGCFVRGGLVCVEMRWKHEDVGYTCKILDFWRIVFKIALMSWSWMV